MGMLTSAIGIATLMIVTHTLAEKSITPLLTSSIYDTRGKRDTTSVLASDEFSKRAPMGFQGMRGKKDVMGRDVNDNQDDFEKRALMGFHGVRGKKNDFVMSDLNEAFYNDDYEKRVPMEFQGIGGKKTMADDEYYKRAMMGMRGKKSPEEVYEDTQKRNNLGLPEMMSNKLYMNEYPSNFEKRAMSMGFQGMRGKKSGYDLLREWERRVPLVSYDDIKNRQNVFEELENLEKRAIMGFQGMRGKKQYMDSYYNDYAMDPFKYEKRAPMGFVGMRGKRSERSVNLQDSKLNDNPMPFNKRTSYGFFGMREKKIPQWEMRGKFIGVRGKKWSSDNLNNGDNPINNGFDNVERIGSKSGATKNFGTQ